MSALALSLSSDTSWAWRAARAFSCLLTYKKREFLPFLSEHALMGEKKKKKKICVGSYLAGEELFELCVELAGPFEIVPTHRIHHTILNL
jgi:hypothetical protein